MAAAGEEEDEEGDVDENGNRIGARANDTPGEARMRAFRQTEEASRSNPVGANFPRWTPMGPSPLQSSFTRYTTTYAGRISTIAVDPANAAHWLIGSASGGIWETTDSGIHWLPRTDDQPSLFMGAIAFAPSNSRVVYAGTGDFDFNGLGVGVLKSADGGTTWNLLPASAMQDVAFKKIAVDPANSEIVMAATSGGVYRSLDGGTNWTLQISGVASDLATAPTDFRKQYAAVSVGAGFALYKSLDGGANFLPMPEPWHNPVLGIRLALAPSDPNVMYVSAVDRDSGEFQRIQKTIDISAPTPAWTALPDKDLGPQGFYNHTLSVDSRDSNVAYFGGVRPWIWDGTELNYMPADPVHSDQHAMICLGDTLFVANDGGLRSTRDRGKTWVDHNGDLQTLEFYYGDVHPTRKDVFAGGAQDNGIAIRFGGFNGSAYPTNDWGQALTRDGSTFVFSGKVPDSFWAYCNNGEIFRTKDGWFMAETVHQEIQDQPHFIGLLAHGRHDDDLVLCATDHRVWKSENFFSAARPGWAPASPELGYITGLAIAPSDFNEKHWAAGTSSGKLYATVDGGLNWTPPVFGLPEREISSLAYSPSNLQILYIAVAGVSEYNGAAAGQSQHLFRARLEGAPDVQDISYPADVPARSIALDPANPDCIFVGTDMGVWQTSDAGQSWVHLGPAQGMPNVSVRSIRFQEKFRRITAFTFGRGVFAMDAPLPAPVATPFGGAARQAPGRIEAEDFDEGGEGLAFHDNDALNQGNNYRPAEGVDIEPCGDEGGGFNIGYGNAGEWQQYTIDVLRTGRYRFIARVASAIDGGAFHLQVDGVNISPRITVPNTGNWQSYVNVETLVDFKAGSRQLRVIWDGVFNANYYEIVEKPANLEPIAKWTFDTDARDTKGSLHGVLKGAARVENGRLVLNGSAYMETPPISNDMREKTLVVKLALSDLNQGGGAGIGLENIDTEVFDAIVFGERQHAKWMAGSDYFNRTIDLNAPEETSKSPLFVHMAAVYRVDGSIALYRNGRPYGSSWTPDASRIFNADIPAASGGARIQTYRAGSAVALLGVRLRPRGEDPLAGGGLIGEIDEAALYDRALSEDEVAALVDSTPRPVAQWTFETDARDVRGSMHGTLRGDARVENGRLVLNGGGYLQTASLSRDITEKTLVVKVALSAPDQGGGGAMTLETIGGDIFDSIVFAEREERKWLAGSEFWNRSLDLDAPPESSGPASFVRMAAVYKADNSIALYRNGRLYGSPWTPNSPLQTFPAGKSAVLLGLRHEPAVGNRYLTGQIEEAALYDKALTAEQIALLEPFAPLIEWQNPEDIVYGTTLGDAQLNAVALAADGTRVAGSFKYSPEAGYRPSAGGVLISAEFAPDDPSAFTTAAAQVALTVHPAPLRIIAENKTRFYGRENPPVTLRYDGIVPGESPEQLFSHPDWFMHAFLQDGPGDYPITLSFGGDPNYDATLVFGTLTIVKAPLIIRADDKTMTRGEALPALTASYSGFAFPDDPGNLASPARLATAATPNSPGGIYPITVAGAASDNYDITFQNGTLTILDPVHDVTQPGDPIVAVGTGGGPSPLGEDVTMAINNNIVSKYLNFQKAGSGFIVTPRLGATVLTGLTLTSANDAPERDPASFILSGSNDGGTTYTEIARGEVSEFFGRLAPQSIYFQNTLPWTTYRFIVPTVRNPGAANSMQFAEIELLGVAWVGSPVLTVRMRDNSALLTWTGGGTLEVSDNVQGPYESTGVADGQFTTSSTANAKFFRIRK